MSMTKADYRNMDTVIGKMCETARHNGKDAEFLGMYDFAKRLHRIETTLQRLAEDECCLPNYDEAKQERLEKLAVKLVRETLGCECDTNRDPRGFAIRMHLVNENGTKWCNTWDGETSGLNW